MGGYNERYPLVEDYPSNLKLSRMGIPITFWDRIVIKYRSGGISSQGGLSEKYLQISDSIFKNEVLPYCQNPSAAKSDYKAWKNEAIWLREKKRLNPRITKKAPLANVLNIFALWQSNTLLFQ